MLLPAHVQICNLLYRYAELIDSGQLAAAAELFRHARIHTGSEQYPLDAEGLLQTWRSMLKLYPCGTPRTKHMITNPIVQVDEAAGRASCRSYYTVFQATDDFALQPIITGRYQDEFEWVGGEWRFSFRDYTLVDQMGDLSRHLKSSGL